MKKAGANSPGFSCFISPLKCYSQSSVKPPDKPTVKKATFPAKRGYLPIFFGPCERFTYQFPQFPHLFGRESLLAGFPL